MKKFLVIISLSVLLISPLMGCSSKKTTSLDDGTELSEADINAQREARFGDGSIPLAEGSGLFKDINFDYDSSQVEDSARQNLEANAEVLRSNPNFKITLEGHADERGTAEYNMALGSDRAKSVKDMLVSLGISSSRLETISYGEEVPLVQANNEEAYAQNRRVHFSASTK